MPLPSPVELSLPLLASIVSLAEPGPAVLKVGPTEPA